MDQHLRLDALLGRFLTPLDNHAGLEHVTIALTADHGAGPEDVAPTLAALLGVRMPHESDGRVLYEVLP